jgi:hypothetical protein
MGKCTVLAMERGYVLYSTDADCARFRSLKWVNPCRIWRRGLIAARLR